MTFLDDARRLRVATDVEGRFRFDGVPEGAGYLFADKDGFRFHGGRFAPEIVLRRRDEPPGRPMATLPLALTREQRRALAARLLEPAVADDLRGDDSARYQALRWLAALDTARTLEELAARPFKEAWFDDAVRAEVSRQLGPVNLAEARAVAASIRDPSSRAYRFLELAERLPEGRREERHELLGEGLLNARGVQDAAHRLVCQAKAARLLFKLGESKRAEGLLRQGEAEAKALPTAAWAGYARGSFVTDLAVIDLPAALALLEDLKETHNVERHLATIALRLAPRDPDGAERVLGLLKKKRAFNSHVAMHAHAAVGHALAPADPDRARRVAGDLDHPPYRAQALGATALALAGSRPGEAAAVLRRAFDDLAAHVEAGEDSFNNYNDASSLAGTLVAVAERIDAGLVPEFFWRALSLRGLRSAEEDRMGRGPEADAALAVALARYDRAVAGELLDAALQRGRSSNQRRDPVLTAALLTDPARAQRLLDDTPEGPRKNQGRYLLAGFLLAEGDELWKAVYRELSLWVEPPGDF